MMKFKKRDTKDIFKSLARSEGVSVAEIKRDMVVTIEEARNNPDPEKQAEFSKYFGSKTPTPEEFICVMANKVKK